MNALGGDAIAMLLKGVATAEAQFAALVVSTDAINFSAGANLMLLLLEAQEGNWDEIDLMVRSFQRATMALRLSKVPVVVAPAGLTLGGGCEIALHGDRVQAAAETYLGLVEAGVGLIPAGGGTKEMLARATGHLTLGPSTDLAGPVRTVFETIGFAKTSTSAAEARTLGLLRPVDRVSMNRDRVLADAKALALARVAEGYEAPVPRTAIPVGGAPVEAHPQAGRPPRPPRRAAERSRRADRPQAGARARRRLARRAGAGRASSTCSISSARRSCRCAPSRRRWRASSTRSTPASRCATDAWHHGDQGGRSAARARARHAGPLGVDDADGRRRWRAGSASPPIPSAASRARRRWSRRTPATSSGSTTRAARSAPIPWCWSASRSAAASPSTTRRGIRSGFARWCSPRRRARVHAAAGAGALAGRRRGARCRRSRWAPRDGCCPSSATSFRRGADALRFAGRMLWHVARAPMSAPRAATRDPPRPRRRRRGGRAARDRADADRHRRRRARSARPAGEHAAVSALHRRAPPSPDSTAPDTWARSRAPRPSPRWSATSSESTDDRRTRPASATSTGPPADSRRASTNRPDRRARSRWSRRRIPSSAARCTTASSTTRRRA